MADEVLREEEEAVARLVAEVLREMARIIAEELNAADEITAAAFSLRRIGELWRERVPRILGRLFRTADRSAGAVSDVVSDGERPEGYDDLAGRYENGTLPQPMVAYRDRVTTLLDAVGERITAAASAALAEGLAADESTEELRARLLAVLAPDAAQLGEARANRIAATETTRAWNAAAQATATEAQLEFPDVVLAKTWRTREDDRVRMAHAEVDREAVALDAAFDVGGYPMNYPGDPDAPASLTVNCRCVLDIGRAPEGTLSAAIEPTEAPMDEDVTEEHTGAMIALVPTEGDAQRLALTGEGALAANELHSTLAYLGEAADWSPEQREAVTQSVRDWAAGLTGPVRAQAFGAAVWNPESDYPAWVYSVGDQAEDEGPNLAHVHVLAATWAEDVAPDVMPEQHSPYVPHMTAAVTTDPWPLPEMIDRLGPVTYDRVRVAFAGEFVDVPLGAPAEDVVAASEWDGMQRTWTNPEGTALAYEDEETGDGRVFSSGALYWDGVGPWPLQYCDRMNAGHDGAALAGGIAELNRDGARITGHGPLYLSQNAGWEAATLLDQGAPLGVSVDLDNVRMEIVDNTGDGATEEVEFSRASVMSTASGWVLSATGRPAVTASASGVALASATVNFALTSSCGIGRSGAGAVLSVARGGALTAAAGDPDTDKPAVATESADDFTMRITRGRVRGATLVTIPAFSEARIVIDPVAMTEPVDLVQSELDLAASGVPLADRVVAHVRTCSEPVTPVEVAEALGITVVTARRHLREAAEAGRIGRSGRLYISTSIPEGEILAAVTGDTDLPVAPRETKWDGDEAKRRVFEWATDAEGNVDPGMVGMAFLYRDDEADPTTQAAWKLGFADYLDGRLRIVPEAVFAIAGVLEGARGGVDVPESDIPALREQTEDLYEAVGEALGEDDLRAPWDRDDEVTASAWTEMQSLPPMPAAWFREPTAEELPPGSAGVHYEGGRVFGWVAQAGVPHATHGARITVDKLAGSQGLDYSHFLRQRFTLDDGSEVRAGAFTMNVGHHRDGFECETAACQFDDSRTVAAVVTVGMNEGGLWFSGAAGPWLSEWDLRAFTVCQPSYHLTQGNDGRWQLRAVLSVPVPGHSSPLVAAAIDRSNLALTASAAVLAPETAVRPEPVAELTVDLLPDMSPAALDGLLDALAARSVERRAELQARVSQLAATIGEDGPDQKKES